MKPKLKDLRRKLLVDEIAEFISELRGRKPMEEGGDATRRAELARKVELARGKLDDLRRLQRRTRETQARRHQLETQRQSAGSRH